MLTRPMRKMSQKKMGPHRAERAFADKKDRDIKGKMLLKKGKMIKKSEAGSRI